MNSVHTSPQKALTKVLFHLEADAWHGSATETLWAERVDARRVRLRNVPFFAFGVACDDIVFVRDVDGVLEFDGLSIRSGRSAYRVIASDSASAQALSAQWRALEMLGCTFEQGPGRLRAVDVPPGADIEAVYSALERGLGAGVWDFEEGFCANPIISVGS